MKCPKCQIDNPEGANFCVECGGKLERICSSCGIGNALSYKFCNKCGHKLSPPSEVPPQDLSFDEKLTKIQRYLPKGLTEKILNQRDRIEGERKHVTVMFCDMEGFTHIAEKLGPEEAYSIMDQVYELLIHKVHDYEGTVNEMTGDGIMALFGAPIALEDASQRAIRSSLAIHREMAKFSDQLKQEKKDVPPVKMRIGIHTGPVVVGTVGNDLRVEFKAVGDTVNLASRMEGQAQPGTTYITEDTFKLTEGLFHFEGLGQRVIKGKEEPINVYQVIAPSTRRTRFDVSADQGLTPFVGRERELELLLDGFERCNGGRGQAFSIMSEAGIGKSRLLYEFRKAVAHEDVTFLEGRCLSYSSGIAYHPVIDILKANFDIREDDGDSEIREKAQRGLKIIGVDEDSTLPYFLELLSVKDSGIDKIPMSSEVKKDRIIEALKRIVLKGSEIRPLIMAFEDLHWIDKSSEDQLKHLLESIPGAKVLLVFTYRPEFVHTWGAKSYHNQLTLNRLSNRESLMMVSHLLGTEELDKDLEEFILEKTEGVPFFIEELIKSLIDLKIMEREDNRYRITKDIKEVTIPATIQDVIMARIDSLPEGAKGLLQKGSVAGREFGNDMIKEVTNLPEEELLSHLSALKDSELLYERGIYPQSTYIFKHALTQEVAYNSLILKRRMEIHEKIARAIEEIYPERVEEFYEMMAYHYSKSDNLEKAFQYLKLSGKKTTRTHSLWEALSFYRQAIEKLKELSETEENKRKQIEVIKLVEMPMRLLGYPEDSLNVLLEGEKLSKELGDSQAIAAFSALIGVYYTHVGDAVRAKKYLEDCVEQIEQVQDINLIAPIAFDLGLSYLIKGEWSKALDLFPKVIALIEKTNTEKEFFGKPSNCYSMFHVWYGFCAGASGEFTEGKRWLDKGLSLALALDHPYTIGTTEFLYGWFFSMKGDGENCIKHVRNCITNLEKAKAYIYLHMAWSISGLGHYYVGDLDTCFKHMEKGLEIHRELDLAFLLSAHKAHLSMAYLEARDIKNAENCADVALKSSQKHDEKYFEALSRILLGHSIVKSDKSRLNEGKEHILGAIKMLDELKIKSIYAVGFYFLGQTYADVSQKDIAKKNFEKAEVAFREMGMDYWISRTREGLTRL